MTKEKSMIQEAIQKGFCHGALIEFKNGDTLELDTPSYIYIDNYLLITSGYFNYYCIFDGSNWLNIKSKL